MAQRSPVIDAVPRRSRPIDLVHLAKQCLGDEALEHEILRLFDTTIKIYVARFLVATEPEQVVFTLHTIKGAAAGVGAFAVAELAKAMEEDARAGRGIEAERIEDLKMAVEEASAFIGDVLGRE